jgi:hypothetical protein
MVALSFDAAASSGLEGDADASLDGSFIWTCEKEECVVCEEFVLIFWRVQCKYMCVNRLVERGRRSGGGTRLVDLVVKYVRQQGRVAVVKTSRVVA